MRGKKNIRKKKKKLKKKKNKAEDTRPSPDF